MLESVWKLPTQCFSLSFLNSHSFSSSLPAALIQPGAPPAETLGREWHSRAPHWNTQKNKCIL